MRYAIAALLALLASSVAFSQERALSDDQARSIGLSARQQLDVERAAVNRRVVQATKDFQGLKLGLGFGISQNVGDSRVETAALVDGKVRVTDERNGTISAVGEIHRFVVRDPGPCTDDDATGCARWGHGPFFALRTGQNDVIDAGGVGYMIGFRQAADKSQSLNLGIGLMFDPRVKVLGDDVRENQPLPGAETAVRFKNTTGWSAMLTISFGFGS